MDPLPLDPAEDPGKRRRVWCKDCHTPLTDPQSRAARRGPVCRKKHGDATQPHTPQHHVEQDTLPGI